MSPMEPPQIQSAEGAPATAPTRSEQRGRIALHLEELLTVVCRLRNDQPMGSDPQVFRDRVKHWLSRAAREAAADRYSEESITMAGYAVIAFLDESVLNSPQPLFSEWPRRPLQEEIFGEFLGGEAFFTNVNHLLSQPDSQELGDVLEVYLLCLMLGFQGRYATGGQGELDAFKRGIRDKIVRIRGAWGDLSPSWSPPPPVQAPSGMDRVTRWLAASAAGAALFFAVLWLAFFVILRVDGVSF